MPCDPPYVRVVDDDQDRAVLCREVLEAAGYVTGTGAPCGPDDVVVILTAERLVEQVTGLEAVGVIVMTVQPGTHLADERPFCWVQVPVDPGALLRAVEDVLDGDGCWSA